ncbi:inositol-tetrakisphosphate 1-kinase 3-like isoform X1 [Juglans regia]|uniref:Inositol-tetrakisphosphate 1-kinase n=2 Tax=Juglans regia TaxID=51240 RepID=A0A6P9EIB1_JUGRE|nr:inositol-tetrakisphosphate 1-kinase 3-like isoform X1 [Juglans regia]
MGLREEEIVACRNDDKREEDEELGLALAQAQQQQQQQLQWFAVGVAGSPLLPRKLVVVGYALTSKKTKSFLQPKLEGLARFCMLGYFRIRFNSESYNVRLNKGILFVAIDQSKPLSDQGPFDIVLHKLSGKEWRRIIEDYRQTHPEVTVLDPPDAIQHLRNRQFMLQAVADLNLSDSYGKVGVPRQLVIKRDASSIPDAVTKAGLTLPLVAKPLVADGSAKSHELSLAYDQNSLQKLEPPLVLQEFVNHGGVLFKVYIVGEAIKVLRRFSLPDVSKRELSKNAGVYRVPRVSCAAASADDADLDPGIAELPPLPLLERLAKELRRRLGLRLFNLDIIREHGSCNHFYVIDINYFPGYGKMPEYEHIFTDFLLSLVPGRYKKRSC